MLGTYVVLGDSALINQKMPWGPKSVRIGVHGHSMPGDLGENEASVKSQCGWASDIRVQSSLPRKALPVPLKR